MMEVPCTIPISFGTIVLSTFEEVKQKYKILNTQYFKYL